MAVIFAVVGGGAVIGIATSDPYSDYSDYDDYSNYDNYSNYSDAAERRRRRLEDKKYEIENQKYDINSYKLNNVNQYLKSLSLKQQEGVTVSVSDVKKDGDMKIANEEKSSVRSECSMVQTEIKDIDKVLRKINEILEEDK